MDEVWGNPSPIQTKVELEFNSGPLVRGLALPATRTLSYHGTDLGSFPYHQPCPAPKQMDADEINRDCDTSVIHVNKRTHRIRFENETESEVTIVVEPK